MVRTYTVAIEEVLHKEIRVNAENEAEALAIAEDLYNKEEVVLYPEDFVGVDFQISDN